MIQMNAQWMKQWIMVPDSRLLSLAEMLGLPDFDVSAGFGHSMVDVFVAHILRWLLTSQYQRSWA